MASGGFLKLNRAAFRKTLPISGMLWITIPFIIPVPCLGEKEMDVIKQWVFSSLAKVYDPAES